MFFLGHRFKNNYNILFENNGNLWNLVETIFMELIENQVRNTKRQSIVSSIRNIRTRKFAAKTKDVLPC